MQRTKYRTISKNDVLFDTGRLIYTPGFIFQKYKSKSPKIEGQFKREKTNK